MNILAFDFNAQNSSITFQSESTSLTTPKPSHYNCTPLKYFSKENKEETVYFNSFKCPSISPYTPSFLTLSNSASFGYPIHQVIACEGSIMNLQCPNGEFLHINSAYYGIQSSTASDCVSITKHSPSICFNKNTFNRISSVCENHQSCSVIITSNNLGEPCFKYKKQMMIQYQCVNTNALSLIKKCPIDQNIPSICPPLTDPDKQYQKIWCEPSVMSIACGANQNIKILCSFYGIDPNFECSGAFRSNSRPTACYSQSSSEKIARACSGKRTCSLSGDPDFITQSGFIDPCIGFAKMLFIQWECIESEQENSTKIVYASNSKTNKTNIEKMFFCQNSSSLTSNNCSELSESPYMPKFIANSSTTNYEYPVYQQIICNNGKTFITCPSNLVIHINSGYYGIQHMTTVNACISSNPDELPAMCFYPDTLTKLKSMCEYEKSCFINVNANNFGDPCPEYHKQMLIQYQCMEKKELESINHKCSVGNEVPFICPHVQSNNEKVWCENSTMLIECEPLQTISIKCAFYGVHSSLKSCQTENLLNPPICYFKNSFDYISSTCAHKNSCKVSDFSKIFSDPCKGFDKSLYVQWECV